MSYIEAAPTQARSLQFLPARAAGVALALGSLASFVALVFLVQLALSLPSNKGGDAVLTAFTACGYLFFTVTGLLIAYARFLPPSTTRIWDLVRGIISYLSLLWIVCFALSASLLGGTLVPYLECDVLASASCSTAKSLSIRILSACAVALASTLALCILVSLDLHSTQHQARVVIQRTQLVEQRRLVQVRRQREKQQAAVRLQPLMGWPAEFSSGDEEAQLGYGPSSGTSYLLQAKRAATAVQCMPSPSSSPLFRSRGLPPSKPFLQAQAAPAPPALPNPMLSPGKRRQSEHHHQDREDPDSSESRTRRWKGDDGDYRPGRRHGRYEGDLETESRGRRPHLPSFERDDRFDDDETDSTSSTSSSSSSTSHTTDDEAPHQHRRHTHRHHHHDREADARRQHKKKREAEKAAASANVGTAQSAGGLDAGVVDM